MRSFKPDKHALLTLRLAITLISLLILFGGLFYFRHMEKQFADLI